jgi:hypothetical protein
LTFLFSNPDRFSQSATAFTDLGSGGCFRLGIPNGKASMRSIEHFADVCIRKRGGSSPLALLSQSAATAAKD